MSILEIFLVINAFVLGVVVTLAVQYFIAHQRNKKAKQAKRPVHEAVPISPATRDRIAKQAEANLQGVVNRSALRLQHELGDTSHELNKLLERFGGEVLDDEIRLFKANVADIRAATQGSLAGVQDQIAAQQANILKSLATRQAELNAKLGERQAMLEAELDQSFAVQKENLTKQLNDKLNDAVLSFLLETLGHNVDLGAQTDYLIATLDANKASLIQTATDTPAPEGKKA